MAIRKSSLCGFALILTAGSVCIAQNVRDAQGPAPVAITLYTSDDRLTQGHWVCLLAEIDNNTDKPITVSDRPLMELLRDSQPKRSDAAQAAHAAPAASQPSAVATANPNSVVLRVVIPDDVRFKYEPGVNYQGFATDLAVRAHARIFLPITIDLGNLPPEKIKLNLMLSIKGLETVQSGVRETEIVPDSKSD